MPRRRWNERLLIVLVFAWAASAPAQVERPPAGPEAEVALVWFELALPLIRATPGFSPPVASRALAYMGIALHEAIVPATPGAQSLVGQLNGLSALPRPAGDRPPAAAAAAHAALELVVRELFSDAPAEAVAVLDRRADDLTRRLEADLGWAAATSAFRHGRELGAAILAWAATDGWHPGADPDARVAYVPGTHAGAWVATSPNYAPALLPGWGRNRPFALSSATACPVTPPYPYDETPSSDFHREALEVYRVAGAPTDEERAIARFWSDDPGRTATPPGHWISIANQVLDQRDGTLLEAAETYARLGIALADAFIACWHAKYQYDLIRPISYIARVIDPAWNAGAITDAVLTPPFPEYPSGHSVQSAAAAHVMTELFGELAFTDRTHEAAGLPPRAYPSFQAAAEEAAMSRFYGGIHYRSAIEHGLAQGRCIGETVSALRLRTPVP
jgi:hypothetical protein